jgi:hypothetical protein
VTGEKGEWTYASEQLGAGAFYGAMRVFGARNVVLGDCQGDQRQIRDQRYARCGDRPEQAHGTLGVRTPRRSGWSGRSRPNRRVRSYPRNRSDPRRSWSRKRPGWHPAGGRTGQACAVSASARGWFTDRAQARRLRYPYGGDQDGEPIVFCGHPRRDGSSYCTPHFRLTQGPGTASERAAGRILPRLVEAA